MTIQKGNPLILGTKVKVEDHVSLYGSKEAVIVGIERGFKTIDEKTGEFISDGLVTMENMIKSISIPYDFDGETLQVHHEEYPRVSKFYKYYYTIRILDGEQLVLTTADLFNIVSTHV